MKNYLLLSVLFLMISNAINAQFVKQISITPKIGYGMSYPQKSTNKIISQGFITEGELILKITSWVDIKPYIGAVFTDSRWKDIYNKAINEKVSTNALLLGAKARLRIPIPWVSPFIEIGIGTSVGKFETITHYENISKKGIIQHFPFALGLELGKNNKVDLVFSYYSQWSVSQTTGGFMAGINIPL
ncbi:conserved exported hypothetical protein [Capnocytophaga cynodegmi]|uniref:Outer membrane protein beta-barrel domain-containing protein n=2 Tax=Capnocytophaga cynodegmi TaxID=28189 RepID=A0A0B7HJ78_9FLAO|nr:conserved exported hypothetical protein [Capnocytophaga cynodegmi]CEN38679.1 conserved exported hypothetical protein [Capnocytophaga cynodegmi]